MKTSIIAPSAASDLLAMAADEYVWASRTGTDAVLELDFGSPHLRVKEPSQAATKFVGLARTALARRIVVPAGRWHLFVESGLWCVTAMGMKCSRADAEEGSQQKVAQVTKCLSLLDGQKLTAVTQTGIDGEWQFAFDLGGRLSIQTEVVAARNKAEAVWTCFLENDSSLSYMSDKTFVFEETTRASA